MHKGLRGFREQLQMLDESEGCRRTGLERPAIGGKSPVSETA
ncbi:hypothetical protein MTY_1262 [Moorella thermoacetica Y72]|uniref:Uncharacterized protein n=1 Tax=Moorella thermoacetica Y72 TaxID=1325331 RepID=A0A0S6UB10_NEOTH|nr:hypothetical protein MOOCA_26600 [Moorella thermoacetica]TYL06474.1 hypothetical protein MOLA_26750 [Moorella thermoacetica]GAF25925.1 hypothetical protein MTY_1262 [Moorella thermoacetica Y72]